MNANSQNLRRWLLAMMFAAALGCAREPAAPSVATSPARSTAAAAPASAKPAAQHAREARKAKAKSKQPAAATPAAEYVGPFPHRTNPFAMPDAAQVATVAQQRTAEKKLPAERLLGFVNVDGRRALLQIDGKVWAAQQGESRDGIEVVEIAPAHVTLRRDNSTWNLSLGRSG